MKKHFCLHNRCGIFFGWFLLASLGFGYAQQLQDSLEIQYKALEDINIDYQEKVEKIDHFIESKKGQINSIQLSYLYNRFSKLNNRNKDYQNAILNGKKALEIQTKFIDSIPSTINNSYNNLAYFHKYSGDETKAIEVFKSLTEQSYKDRYTIMAYAIGLTTLYIDRGDYYRVLNYLHEARNTIEEANSDSLNKELYRVYLSYSRIYMKIGDVDNYHKAIEFLKKSETSIDHLSDDDQTKKRIIIYNRYGNIYDELEDSDKAILYYKKALDLSINQNSVNSERIGTIYNNLGYIHARLEKYDDAYRFYEKALEYAPFETSIQDNLGDYYLHKQDFEKALTHYQKAINYSIERYKDTDYRELPELDVLVQSYDLVALVNDMKDKAKAWLDFYIKTQNKEYLQHALTTITRADKVVDIIRSESLEQQSKFFWREKELDLYMLATSICYKLDQPEEAFYFMEKSKSLSLLENLTHEEAKDKAGLPENIREKEYLLRYQIYDISENIRQDSTLTKSQKESLILKEKKIYEDFLNSLEKDYPSYYNYKKEINISSYNESYQKVVNDNTSLIQYILSEKEGYGILMSKQEKYFYKLPEVSELNRELLKIGRFLGDPVFSLEEQKSYQELSISVYKKLFPFPDAENVLQNKKVIIIPDYILQSFPFETLVIPPGTKNEEVTYLLNLAEISYLYSMSLSKSVESKKRISQYDFVGFAPIYFDKVGLVDLKRSTVMMNEIQQLYKVDAFFEQKASKSNFIKESGKYKTIHLSTHASSLNNDEPWIAFYDDKLLLSELYFVKNQADLVILDACKTGIGKLQPGEGVMSLSRGFFYSGAKSVISSLWNTNEKSSNEIITSFYEYLKQGDTKSTALRKAKLQYIEDHQGSEISPYFWGSLILTGNTDTITLSSEDRNYLWLLLPLFFIIILIVRYYKTQ
ncbi:CHAT domain-containing tetratricopeptide repeat protein [Aquimarina sp. 2201CG5-10]|uniref:CHAT domain-containing protein n=1 Tax=Aquimarina callyspongiae TaxID=3098150 RepID=UPI002AB44472|nr:CHAT domain-containing tetratricopeptide repeat protein [Aquimarina sp. 2201CG5-10]MDY8134896.1 CHAT domain-containing tetratricopeptide repeat protein [Aquimarina sp. 2201CG5-10]